MFVATPFARVLVPLAAVAVLAAPSAASSADDLRAVENHLTQTQSMVSSFTQTDGKGRKMSGTMSLKRPGRIRFEYGGGANMLLVGNGKTLSFIDYEVGQKSSWALNRTPLGILLSSDPDVDRIARIVPSDDPRVLVVRARDPSRNEYGTLILAFIRERSAPGGLRLYGWTAVDAQGKRTMVKLSNQRYNVAVSPGAFTYAEPKKKRG